ncbi:hypothetical protein AB4381_12160 [Vibrio splendidus]
MVNHNEKKTNYSPVLITVYDRFEHFSSCIESLKLNYNAEHTPLYIAIDYPIDTDNISIYNKLLDYSNSINGFKYVKVIAREKNVGPYLNAKLMQDLVFEKYERFIRTEDDNIFSENFINYMNYMLDKYDNDDSIFSVNAFNYPIYDECINEVYHIREFYPYGFASWKNKYLAVDRNLTKFFPYFLSPLHWYDFIKNCNFRVLYGLIASILQNKTYTDYVFTFHLNLTNMSTVVPKMSFVRNQGQDGSGSNSGLTPLLLTQEMYSLDYELDEVVDLLYAKKDHNLKRDSFYINNLPKISWYKVLLTPLLFLFVYLRQFFNPYKF